MRNTSKLGLALYESNDKFRVLESTDSLNKNMELIDAAIITADSTWGDFAEEEEDET